MKCHQNHTLALIPTSYDDGVFVYDFIMDFLCLACIQSRCVSLNQDRTKLEVFGGYSHFEKSETCFKKMLVDIKVILETLF